MALVVTEAAEGAAFDQDVCAILKVQDVTPGLYGLCKRHCELLNCDEAEDPIDCEMDREDLLERYNELRQEDEPIMPCLRCPCWTSEKLATVGFTWSSNEISVNAADLFWLEEKEIIAPCIPYGVHHAKVAASGICVYMYTNPSNPLENEFLVQTVDPDEYEVCLEEIIDQIGNLVQADLDVYCDLNLCSNLCEDVCMDASVCNNFMGVILCEPPE